jgi:hypothetical protein
VVGEPGAHSGRVLVADQMPGQLLPAQPLGREQAGDLVLGRALGAAPGGGEPGQVDQSRVAVSGAGPGQCSLMGIQHLGGRGLGNEVSRQR